MFNKKTKDLCYRYSLVEEFIDNLPRTSKGYRYNKEDIETLMLFIPPFEKFLNKLIKTDTDIDVVYELTNDFIIDWIADTWDKCKKQ